MKQVHERGSISIFFVIIIPIVLTGVFSIYQILLDRTVETEAKITSAACSEVKLSEYSDAIYKNYKLLSYEIDDTWDKEIRAALKKNDIENYEVESIKYSRLSDPKVFYSAALASADQVVPIKMIEKVSEWMIATDSFKKVGEKAKEKFKIQEKISDIMKSESIQKRFKSLKRAKKWQDRADELDDILEKLDKEEREFQVLSSEIDEPLDEAQKYLENQHEEIKKAVSDIESIQNKIKSKENEIKDLDQEIDSINSKINALKGDGSEDGSKPHELEINALRQKKKGKKEEISDLDQAIEKYESKIDDRVETIVDKLDVESPTWLDNLRSLPAEIEQLEIEIEPSKSEIDESGDRVTNYQKEFEKIEFDETMADKLLLNEYYLGVFKSLDKNSKRNIPLTEIRDTRDSKLDGEVEYLLGHSKHNSTNVSEVYAEIYALRLAANLSAILTDSKAQSEISKLAIAVPPPYKILVVSVVNIAWASAESYLDLRDLVDGKGVSLIKSLEKFNISLNGLMSTSVKTIQNENTHNHTLETEDELYYIDYLRVLLSIQPIERTTLRAMDVIENNLYEDEITLDDFAYGHHLELSSPKNKDIILNKFYE